MTNEKTSRRRFVQLAGGLALALRHGLLPAQTDRCPAARYQLGARASRTRRSASNGMQACGASLARLPGRPPDAA